MLITEEHISAAYVEWSSRNCRTWGMLDAEWLEATRHVASELERTAGRERTITYGELCEGVSFVHLEHWHHVLADVLMIVGIACDIARMPMLTAIAVNKDHGTPGGEFFDAAREHHSHLSEAADARPTRCLSQPVTARRLPRRWWHCRSLYVYRVNFAGCGAIPGG